MRSMDSGLCEQAVRSMLFSRTHGYRYWISARDTAVVGVTVEYEPVFYYVCSLVL
jgi:hypothetical protein